MRPYVMRLFYGKSSALSLSLSVEVLVFACVDRPLITVMDPMPTQLLSYQS